MKKNLFEISEQEKREILEQHNVLKESPKYKIGINFITEQGIPEDPDEPSSQTDDSPTIPTIPGVGDGVAVTAAIFAAGYFIKIDRLSLSILYKIAIILLFPLLLYVIRFFTKNEIQRAKNAYIKFSFKIKTKKK